jgi:predicted Ser/Thr protein kinase
MFANFDPDMIGPTIEMNEWGMVRNCLDKDNRLKIYLEQKVGNGTASNTYAACLIDSPKPCDTMVAKVMTFSRPVQELNFRVECAISNHASKYGFGPKVHQTIVCKAKEKELWYGVIVMERLDGTLATIDPNNEDLDAIFDCMGRMHASGIWHNDLHQHNIMFKQLEKRFYIIDYGRAWPFFEREPPAICKIADANAWLRYHFNDNDHARQLMELLIPKNHDKQRFMLPSPVQLTDAELSQVIEVVPKEAIKSITPEVFSLRYHGRQMFQVLQKMSERLDERKYAKAYARME